MPIVKWTEEMSVGVAALDRDHQRLLGLINQLYEVIRLPDAQAEVGAVIGELVHYAHRHCAAEEALMARAGYPGLEEHRKSHDLLRERVAEYQDEYRAAPRSVVAAELFEFLADWLIHHIRTEDRAYAPALAGLADAP